MHLRGNAVVVKLDLTCRRCRPRGHGPRLPVRVHVLVHCFALQLAHAPCWKPWVLHNLARSTQNELRPRSCFIVLRLSNRASAHLQSIQHRTFLLQRRLSSLQDRNARRQGSSPWAHQETPAGAILRRCLGGPRPGDRQRAGCLPLADGVASLLNACALGYSRTGKLTPGRGVCDTLMTGGAVGLGSVCVGWPCMQALCGRVSGGAQPLSDPGS